MIARDPLPVAIASTNHFNSDSNRRFSSQGLAAGFKFFVPLSVLLFESGDHLFDEAPRPELIPQLTGASCRALDVTSHSGGKLRSHQKVISRRPTPGLRTGRLRLSLTDACANNALEIGAVWVRLPSDIFPASNFPRLLYVIARRQQTQTARPTVRRPCAHARATPPAEG